MAGVKRRSVLCESMEQRDKGILSVEQRTWASCCEVTWNASTNHGPPASCQWTTESCWPMDELKEVMSNQLVNSGFIDTPTM